MRIIDKNHDFYDYLQDPTDDTLVFDRRGSFLLDKKRICEEMHHYIIDRDSDPSHKIISLQCGAAFWLFLVTITKFEESPYLFHENEMPEDYELELLLSWKDYDTKSRPIRVAVQQCIWNSWKDPDDYSITEQRLRIDTHLTDYIYNKGRDVTTLKTSVSTKNGTNQIVHEFPLLRGIGISNLVNPVEVFCGIEEHFSRAKTASERTEPLGATNNDKIIMHGFDTKVSFRGK